MKSQYAYKETAGDTKAASTAAFDLINFIPAEERGMPDLPRNIDDSDKINLANVIASATPRFYNNLHKEFYDATGINIRKINKTQCNNMRLFFNKRGKY